MAVMGFVIFHVSKHIVGRFIGVFDLTCVKWPILLQHAKLCVLDLDLVCWVLLV